MKLTRRDTLRLTAGLLVAANWKGGRTMAETPSGELPAAYRGGHEPKPLPFDPARLTGLSERLIRSHHENNYTGAVKRLNLIEQELGRLPKDAPPYRVGALKREELVAANSMILHELYFGNLGGDGKPSGAGVDMLKGAYGSLDAWEHEFRQTGMSLAGGSGWVLLTYDPHEQAVRTVWASDHTQGLAGGSPVLVMDMYEHSYHIDYGANARGYIDAFFKNINWEEVDRRVAARKPRG